VATVYLGLGTNLGDRESNLREALRRIGEHVEIDAVSTVYLSEPVGYRAQPAFWNLVVRGETRQRPLALLRSMKRIERALGRRPSFRNAPRPIDIDILFYGDVRLAGRELELPHPRISEREFVLRPLLELEPGLRDPRTGQPLRAGLDVNRTVGMRLEERKLRLTHGMALGDLYLCGPRHPQSTGIPRAVLLGNYPSRQYSRRGARAQPGLKREP
jgi:2-amino-4-hydroxy-6-hydroxymethyldihydropteridine diphosphokinase